MAVSFQPAPLESIVVSQVGKLESPLGSNWGKDVQHYLAHTNTRIPSPWCAAFVRFCLDSAGIKSTITAYSPSAHNAKNVVYARGQWLKEMETDDVFTIYFPSMHRIAHTGFAHRKVNNHICETIEGNSNAGGGREGVGVFRRQRPFNTLYTISRWR
jgi:hypothetical protein